MNIENSKIFFSSDTHFGHDREFLWKPRGFENIKEMDEAIIERWNSIVSPQDVVFHLGDVTLGNLDYGISCLNRLNGTIYIIAGNHDTDTRIARYEQEGYNVVHAFRLNYQGYHFYLSHYPTLTANLEAESLKKCTCNLFGHTHQKTNFYQDIPFMYHVGVDSHNCYPVEINQIIKDMKEQAKTCLTML